MARQCILMLEELFTIMNQENSHLQEGNSSEKKQEWTDPKLKVLKKMHLQLHHHNNQADEDIESMVTNKCSLIE